MNKRKTLTHEEYIRKVAEYVIATASEEDREVISRAKLLYGTGRPGLRGQTIYDSWKTGEGDSVAMVEICALGQSSPVQIAGTVIHELAHVAAGHKAGHGKGWKQACDRLGLRRAKAAGMNYLNANFRPDVREFVASLTPNDGQPFSVDFKLPMRSKPGACPMGIGTRGGKSRGKGSGSRLRKWVCDCGVIVRVSSDDFRATCDRCGSKFHQG